MRTLFISCMLVLISFTLPAKAQAYCGDFIIRESENEECEGPAGEPDLDGKDCTDLNFVSGTLRCNVTTCRFDTDDCSDQAGPLCGNGFVESGEECEGGCECNEECELITPLCGNQCLEGLEECDLGAGNSDSQPDICRTDCVLPHCGDGVTDSGEECDDYYNSDFAPDTCRSNCMDPSCGDGVVDPMEGEQCDLGANNSDAIGSPCTTLCLIPFCGNGVPETGETCDDGNASSADECTQLCRPAICGDSFVWAQVEACDDASCSYACDGALSNCGNGVLDEGEDCDDGAANAETADVACRTDCALRRCGDGVLDMGEQCDRTPGCLSDCTLLPL